VFFDEFGKRVQPSFKNTSMKVHASTSKDLLLIINLFCNLLRTHLPVKRQIVGKPQSYSQMGRSNNVASGPQVSLACEML